MLFPDLTPFGTLILHWKAAALALHVHVAVLAEIPGPRRVAWTMCAAASAVAVLAVIGLPVDPVSRKPTVIGADLLSTLPA